MRQRGFTLNELMIVIALVLAVSGIVAGVVRDLEMRDRATAAYAEDLRGLRRAAAALRQDLRAASALSELDYDHEDGRLLRHGKVLARNISRFVVSTQDRTARVRLQLAPRSDAPARREALLDFRVRMRGAREAPR